jgi:formylmethanofuran dehydrogenase subunit E
MRSFEELLAEAEQMHGGHACPGQVLGVRMAMRACRELDIEEPGLDNKRLIVFIEIDRCAADAIAAVTGCRLGKRTLKYVDYGKMAATFLDTQTGQAVRVLALEESRDKAWRYARPGMSKCEVQREAYKVMPDDWLFAVQRVEVDLRPEDRPGPPISRLACERCGERINDRREVHVNGYVLCRPCADGSYYRVLAVPPSLSRSGLVPEIHQDELRGKALDRA